jgi:hypothetical protein
MKTMLPHLSEGKSFEDPVTILSRFPIQIGSVLIQGF